MTRYAAFLRGMNLGNRRIRNEELRDAFDALEEVDDPAPFLASGNVVFDSGHAAPAGLERMIEDHLREALGYEVDTFVRSLEHLRGVAEPPRFPEAGRPGYKVHVLFLKEPGGAAAADRLRELAPDGDAFRVEARETFWLRHGGLSDVGITPADLERALEAETSTMRTLNTVRRLVAKFGDADG